MGVWNYDQGKQLKRHIHKRAPRVFDWTQEVLFVIQGKIKAQIYSRGGTLIKDLVVRKDDILILIDGGHGYEVLEDSTLVLEVKNGPYLGAKKDRRRF